MACADIAERISVIIPARNAEQEIQAIIPSILRDPCSTGAVEIIVVDDHSTDRTADRAIALGARVVSNPVLGNPGAARNAGAAASHGEILVFLDADCRPHSRWLSRLIAPLGNQAVVVGGSFGPPQDQGLMARADYFSGWYHVHPWKPAGYVKQHPPGNLAVRRDAFLATRRFDERHPIAYAHEELIWQADILAAGERIYFAPDAMVEHRNRPGLGNLLRRNYRWGYSAIAAKRSAGNIRFAWLYEHPLVAAMAGLPLGILSTAYIIGCWLRAGRVEPLLLAPAIMLGRIAYGAAMMVGGVRSSMQPDGQSVRPYWE